MPTWLKVTLITLGTLILIGALAVFVIAQMIGGFVQGFVDAFNGPDQATGSPDRNGPQEVRFLQTEGFDPTAPGAAIILHPAFTGLSDPVVVTDPDLIAAAADTAFFTDDRGAETRMVLLSILFLSPPGNGTRATMVSLFQDGREVGTLTCYIGQCPRAGPPTSPYELAGLDTAAAPLALESEIIAGVPAARAFEADLLARPDVFLTSGLEGLPDAANRFDGYIRISLPSSFGPWEEMSSYRGEAEEAAFDTALADLREATATPFEITYNSARVSWTQYLIHDRATDRPITDANGYSIVDGWLPQIVPQADLWVAADDAEALRAALLTHDWPAPNAPPSDAFLNARMADVLAVHDLPGAPEDYQHRATVYGMVDEVTVGPFREPEVYISYYRLAE